MSNCYCGLATRANRLKWASFGVLLVVGFILLFAIFGQVANCSKAAEIERCRDRMRSENRQEGPPELTAAGHLECEQLESEQEDCVEDRTVLISGLFYFWILAWILASIPLYMMCCCTQPPSPETSEGMQMGMRQTFEPPPAVPLPGYPLYPGVQPAYLSTPTPREELPPDVPMYTAIIK